jgi:predicted peptidase
MKAYQLYGIIGLFLIFGCEGDAIVEEPEVKERTATDVINDFKSFAVNPGVNDFQLETLERGKFWNFRVIGPSSASENNKRPLVMTFHGASGGSSTAHQHTDCYDEPGLAVLDAYIIAPNAGAGEWYDQANQQQVLALLDLAKTNWHVDIEKILATGYSNGGNASWFYADFFSEQFTAAIPMASSYNPQRSDGTVPKINIPLYVIHGENDELFPVADTQSFVQQSKDAGSVIEFVIAPGLTHFKPCEYVEALKSGVSWVQNEVWN